MKMLISAAMLALVAGMLTGCSCWNSCGDSCQPSCCETSHCGPTPHIWDNNCCNPSWW